MVDDAVRVEGVFILETRPLGNRFRQQTPLAEDGASIFEFALLMGIVGQHLRRAEQEDPHAQRHKAGDSARAERESMAEKKRHVSEWQTTRQSTFSIDFLVVEAKEK